MNRTERNRPTKVARPDVSVQELSDPHTLLGVALALVDGVTLTAAEQAIATLGTASTDKLLLEKVRRAIAAGHDPLGRAYSKLRATDARRAHGQTFTPDHVVTGMVSWLARQGKPISRIVDPGAGTGRYTLAALRAFPGASSVAVELDPFVALLLRANLRASRLESRCTIVVGDFRALRLPHISGVTAWIGNPPYVRHHGISSEWKDWYTTTLSEFGHSGSQLAGLHLHFFLKTLQLASPGDVGCYVTAAEWIDVGYGKALRDLLTNGLGGQAVFIVDPKVQVFEDAMVSAAITCFSPGAARSSLQFARIESEAQVRELHGGRAIEIGAAKSEPKWSFLVRGGRGERPSGYVELGELFRVSRGQVTGLNRVWVARADTPPLPSRFLVPAITDSSDIVKARRHIIDAPDSLRRVICLPRELKDLSEADRASVESFLAWARQLGADKSYIATHRKSWWSVEFNDPAPVVMTYMGRRPPVFAVNQVKVPFINVAHGLYPREPVSDNFLRNLVTWLNSNVTQELGRVYAGGLTKFEPSEAMRILIPEALAA